MIAEGAMAPNPRVGNAFKAMRALGISERAVRPVLKKLLELYDKNWELIEEENYRVLADAIFDNSEDRLPSNAEGSTVHAVAENSVKAEVESPLKRSSLKQSQDQSTPDNDEKTFTRRKRTVDSPSPVIVLLDEESNHSQMPIEKRKLQVGDAGKSSALSPQNGRGQESSYAHQVKKSVVQPVVVEFSHQHCRDKPLIKPELKEYEDHVPLAVIYPLRRGTTRTNGDGRSSASTAEARDDVGKNGGHGNPVMGNEVGKNRGHGNTMARNEVGINGGQCGAVARNEVRRNEGHCSAVARNEFGSNGGQCNAVARHDVGKNGDHGNAMTRHEVEKNGSHVDATPQCDIIDEGQGGRLEQATSSPEPIKNFEIASSPLGEVKINFSLNSANTPPDFHAPSVEDVLKRMESRYLHSYKIVDPNFSLTNLMKEMCRCFLQLGSSAAEDNAEHHIESTEASKDIVVRSNLNMPASPIVSLNSDSLHKIFGTNIPKVLPFNNVGDRKIELNMPNVPRELAQSYPLSLVPVHQNKSNHDSAQPLHNVKDISKGEEKVKITVINGVNSWPYPSKFYYIPQNIVYQSAYVDFSLARIGDENCCMNCFNDCLASSIPCACAIETGGEFAYTSEGLLKQEFLDRCISMKHNPQKDHFVYCKVCPLERSKNEDIIDPCQGHLVRKFIKECWSKCGCSKYCGNRVVQRGINKSLQVFFTQEGKGWGLRTLEFLPKGTFICEYVGEILTNIELYERNTRRSGNEEHTYPVLLDADWGSEGILKDEEALCLDATSYGNVARFINHRCHDANCVEIPVEIESPDHHYYHLAFFTTRNVESLEELCWDYGIDFEDQNHPIKAFTCKCGSNGCRDKRIRPRKRSKQTPLVLG